MVAALGWGSASLTEVLWTVIGLAGMLFTYANMRDARKYVRAVDMVDGRSLAQYHIARAIAFGHWRSEMLRMAKLGIVTLVGVSAMLTPAAVPTRPVTPVQVILTMGLFTIALLIVLQSALDRMQRRYLTRPATHEASERRRLLGVKPRETS